MGFKQGVGIETSGAGRQRGPTDRRPFSCILAFRRLRYAFANPVVYPLTNDSRNCSLKASLSMPLGIFACSYALDSAGLNFLPSEASVCPWLKPAAYPCRATIFGVPLSG